MEIKSRFYHQFAEDDVLELHVGSLDVNTIHSNWYDEYKMKNCGAFVSFVGIVRDEDGIDGLSFDVHEPILNKWFEAWKNKLKKQNSHLLMAHSSGDVLNHESSFMCAVISPKRRVGLEMLDEFVEDFKANAPIWKYDLKDGERIYAKARSKALPNAGILS